MYQYKKIYELNHKLNISIKINLTLKNMLRLLTDLI